MEKRENSSPAVAVPNLPVQPPAPATPLHDELVAALQTVLGPRCVGSVVGGEYFRDNSVSREAIKQARAALAKATGNVEEAEEQGFAVSGEGTGSPHG